MAPSLGGRTARGFWEWNRKDLVSILFHFQYYVEAIPGRTGSEEEWKACAQDQHYKESCKFWVAVERCWVAERAYDGFAVVETAEDPGRVRIAE